MSPAVESSLPIPPVEWLQQALAGDEGARETLLIWLAPLALRYANRICGGDVALAEDVAQDALLSAFVHLSELRSTATIRGWLWQLVRSAYSHRTRSAMWRSSDSVDPLDGALWKSLADGSAGPEKMAAELELAQLLWQEIARLPDDQREVLLLRDMEAMPASEVAARLGLRIEAVKSRLHRARTALQASMRHRLGESTMRSSTSSPCPDVVQLLGEHLEGELSSSSCAAMHRHLEECPQCDSVCRSLRRALSMCASEGAEHVSPSSIQRLRTALARVRSLQCE
jgi:RNA polymerase sigma-70 factor (ECF subfamily)